MVDGISGTAYAYDQAGQLLSEGGLWPNDTVNYTYEKKTNSKTQEFKRFAAGTLLMAILILTYCVWSYVNSNWMLRPGTPLNPKVVEDLKMVAKALIYGLLPFIALLLIGIFILLRRLSRKIESS